MAKRKAGLHKEITSIFDGVPLQKRKDAQQAPQVPSPDFAGSEGHHKRDAGRFGGAVSTGLPTAQQIPTAAKYQQAQQPLPKAAPTGQPKVHTAAGSGSKAGWQQTLEQVKNKLFAQKPGVSAGRQKMMTVLIPVLFIVLVFVFIKVLSPPVAGTRLSPGPGASGVAAGSVNRIAWQIPAPYPSTLRDPMRLGPATTTQADTGELTVTGIVDSQDGACAIINDVIARVGDKVSGATVMKIDKDGVEFEMNGKRWTQRVQ